ncbi:hypothetical protein HJC23_000616 [Cyclotella cryptica]|uniref:Uncharacterized protein n=1 Tax=Cyclotella cryptica TaxID=29204 RepID=A0ABD3Q764_9STRA
MSLSNIDFMYAKIKCLTSGRHQLNPAKEYYGHQYDQMIPTLTLNQPRKGGAVAVLLLKAKPCDASWVE